jgi:acetylornithine deacetylase/succinyl-diaminopimelate desuccinylase-like protein
MSPIVASVVPSTSIPHPAWFALAGNGLVWVRDAADAKGMRVASADVLRIPRSSGWWQQTIIGPIPAGGIDAVGSAELDAL